MIFQLFEQGPQIALTFVLAIVIGITVHEFAHALAGFLMGDMTAKHEGRLTLNPMSHLDPMGTIMLLFAGFGWGKPTPYNPYNLRYQKWGPAIVALAGPISNLIIVIIMVITLKLLFPVLGVSNLLILFIQFLIFINLMLMVFNLLPIPPLDGSQVAFTLMPPHWDHLKMQLAKNGPFILIGLIILDNILDIGIFGSIYTFFLSILNFFL